jgi:hypothetical protein
VIYSYVIFHISFQKVIAIKCYQEYMFTQWTIYIIVSNFAQIVSTPTVMTVHRGKCYKNQLLQYTFVNTCTFHKPFQFWYTCNSNGLEQTHSGYFRSFCSQFTLIVITLVHCLQLFAFMTYFFHNIQLIMCNLLLYRWVH